MIVPISLSTASLLPNVAHPGHYRRLFRQAGRRTAALARQRFSEQIQYHMSPNYDDDDVSDVDSEDTVQKDDEPYRAQFSEIQLPVPRNALEYAAMEVDEPPELAAPVDWDAFDIPRRTRRKTNTSVHTVFDGDSPVVYESAFDMLERERQRKLDRRGEEPDDPRPVYRSLPSNAPVVQQRVVIESHVGSNHTWKIALVSLGACSLGFSAPATALISATAALAVAAVDSANPERSHKRKRACEDEETSFFGVFRRRKLSGPHVVLGSS